MVAMVDMERHSVWSGFTTATKGHNSACFARAPAARLGVVWDRGSYRRGSDRCAFMYCEGFANDLRVLQMIRECVA